MKLNYISSAAIVAGALLFAGSELYAERLVILHTNDTHSQIDPDDKDRGGVLRRKALIDSVRNANDNVILVDAGDAVQGTLYFTLFGGEVEGKVMNEMEYDIQILGNHEFDNGVDALARQWRNLDAEKLSTNYDFRGTELDGLFEPYTIKEVGDKKIGFIAINLVPKGMIADKNIEGVKYLDGLKAANATAWHLKHNEHVDMVVAVTHVGYSDEPGYADVDLAAKSDDIDIIIGGHSHTTINPADPKSPASRVLNAAGDTVIVAQTGKSGFNVGEIDIDLDNGTADYKLLTVDKRFDNRIDSDLVEIIAPYKEKVDSVRAIKIGKATKEFVKNSGLMNWMADFVKSDAGRLTDKKIDVSIVNKGGIRANMPKGDITKGMIMQIFPFDNHIVVLELSGAELLEAMDVMAKRGGDGVSGNVSAVFDSATGKCTEVLVDGEYVDTGRTYIVATIDYLAGGGDYMTPLTKGREIVRSKDVLFDDMINSFVSGALKNKKQTPDNTKRMRSL